MSRTFWIVLIIVAAVFLLILLFSAIPRIKESLQHINGWLYIFLILLVLAVGIFAAVKIFGPSGSDSLLSESVEGGEAGDADVDANVERDKSGDGTEFSESRATEGNSAGDTTIYIRIKGDRITIGRTPFEDLEQFGRAIESLSLDGKKVCLVDNYAIASVYHAAQDKLKEIGIKYFEMTDDEVTIGDDKAGAGEDSK